MLVIPAIDLKNGKCVRLEQGRDDRTTVYSGDPVTTAHAWVGLGARRLHVVNLDGAFGRHSVNLEIVRAIAQSVDAEIQFGGGLRSPEAIRQALDAGVRRVVLGTVAIEEPRILAEALTEVGPSRLIVALDGLEGRIATRGWTTITELAVEDLARRLRGDGVEEILYTDIQRDGMLSGPDLVTLGTLGSSGLRVIASGGVSGVADIRALRSLQSASLIGVIVGKALYEKRVTLPELMRAAQEHSGESET